MDIYDYLASKEIDNPTTSLQTKILQAFHSEQNQLKNRAGLKKSSIEIGLWLMNVHPKKKSKPTSAGEILIPALTQQSVRFKEINKLADPVTFCQDHEDLLLFMFGEEKTPYIQEAWKLFPTLPYQKHSYRRSFRAPHLTDMHFVRQLEYLLDLVRYMSYEISMEEYILYSNQLYDHGLSYLLAAAINMGEENLTGLLLDIAYMRHETARISRTIIKGMLISDSQEAWEAIEKLLLSAQRQEGLRQSILETLDECSIGAIKHLLPVITEHKLARFSSVVRAIDVWAGLGWENERETSVRRFLTLAQKYLEHPEMIPAAMNSRDNAEIYMALWAQGVYDVMQCRPLLEQVLKQKTLDKTVVALYMADNIALVNMSVIFGMAYIRHPHLMIFGQALHLFHHERCIQRLKDESKAEMYQILASRLKDIPKEGKTYTGKGFSWLSIQISRVDVFNCMINLVDFDNEAAVDHLLTFWEQMPLQSREGINKKILTGFTHYGYREDLEKEPKKISRFQRNFAFKVLKDRSTSIRQAAMRALSVAPLDVAELDIFLDMLKRKSADTRRKVLELVLKQEREAIQNCVKRLLTSGSREQRLAGLDLLTQLKIGKEVDPGWIQQQAGEFSERLRINSQEQILLDELLVQDNQVLQYGPDNGYGLFDPLDRSPFPCPDAPTEGLYLNRRGKYDCALSQTRERVNEHLVHLKTIFDQHQTYEYEAESWNDSVEKILLANTFKKIKNDTKNMSDAEQFHNYPLADLWAKWVTDAGLDACDIMLIQLGIGIDSDSKVYENNSALIEKLRTFIYFPEIPKMGKYEWDNKIISILKILPLAFPFEEKIAFLGDLLQTIFATLDEGEIKTIFGRKERRKLYEANREIVSKTYQEYANTTRSMSDKQFVQFWQMENFRINSFVFEPHHDHSDDSSLYNYARAYSLNLISKNELLNRIMKPDAIQKMTHIRAAQGKEMITDTFPFLREMLDVCRNRILEIELKRGDSSTSVTHLAQNLYQLFGIHTFTSTLLAMGNDPLHRGYIYSWGNREYNKKEILSTLLKRCHPLADDRQEDFDRLVGEAQLSNKRLIEAATYATQWLPFVANYLGWEAMPSGVWWLHAHANGYHSAETETEIGKYSKVPMKDFQDGAVDVRWFREMYKALGKKKWTMLYTAAKYITDGGGQKRAQLFADVLLGQTKITELKKRIKDKRNQDALKAYGLVALSRKRPEKDVLVRYRLLQQFKKESKQFGAQRQASEGRSIQIAMENLARTAGYPDPLRLSWAMETEEAQRILESASPLIFDTVQVSMQIDEQGLAHLHYSKNGHPIKALPAKYRKDKAFLELKANTKVLRDQYRRTKVSLEAAMVNGDAFSLAEIQQLMRHPVVAPMLQKLVLKSGEAIGIWEQDTIVDISGSEQPLTDWISIAHCTDLYASGSWADWQRFCFDQQWVQPFKQIFRELYVPTADELAEASISRRYAGHQIQPKKTVALLKTRGWIVDYESGLQKVFHKQNFIAKMYAMADWFSPADVESPTLETVEFVDRHTYKTVPFDKIDARIFSEIMRDLDLVVSVAHVGDIDPEASHSSIELRKAIVRESLRLFQLDNVELAESHALIQGNRGSYSVHLGSAVAHQMAGSYLSILPVHSQKRGRMFLPFLDEDPKSAEVLSKILLLAKDQEIHDPTILRQMV
ncbi:MAG: DUF4132 domain-containing protein [Bacteroidota bacterium]